MWYLWTCVMFNMMLGKHSVGIPNCWAVELYCFLEDMVLLLQVYLLIGFTFAFSSMFRWKLDALWSVASRNCRWWYLNRWLWFNGNIYYYFSIFGICCNSLPSFFRVNSTYWIISWLILKKEMNHIWWCFRLFCWCKHWILNIFALKLHWLL